MSTTTNTIDSQRLATAMRRKFGSVKNLLKALGLDESLLTPGRRLALDMRGNRLARDQVENLNGSAPTENAAAQMRLAIEEALGSHENLPEGLVKQIFTLLEKHAPLGHDDEPEDRGAEAEELRKRERMPPALDVESFSKFLSDKGVDAETIKGAVGLVKDALPLNALNGGSLGRGGGPGGVFAAKRAAGMDSAARKFGLSRIEAWGAADHAIDRAPVLSRTGMDKLSKKFPGIESVIV